MSKIITTVSISSYITAKCPKSSRLFQFHQNVCPFSPEWTPPNVALAQVLVAGGLLNQKTNLLLSLQTFLLVEIFASQLVTHPLNNIQSLLIECLWLHRLPTCSSAFTLSACHLLMVVNKGFHVAFTAPS